MIHLCAQAILTRVAVQPDQTDLGQTFTQVDMENGQFGQNGHHYSPPYDSGEYEDIGPDPNPDEYVPEPILPPGHGYVPDEFLDGFMDFVTEEDMAVARATEVPFDTEVALVE